MRRFAVTVSALLVVLLSFASAATAQSLGRMARIGMLCAPACKVAFNEAFVDELKKIGWVEGTTITIERKDPDYHLDQLPALASDLVRSKPDLIVAFTPYAARAAKNATSDIPIVIILVADPVGMGLASSLAHPGGNLTGVATMDRIDFGGKFLGILREVLPQAKRVAVFLNTSNEMHRLVFPETPTAAAKLGFQLDVFDLREAGEVASAIAAAKAQGAEALDIFSDPIFSFPSNRVPDLAVQAGLPSISFDPDFARAGGLISYGPDFLALARIGARYVGRILKGAKAAELPIEQPTKYLLVINLKTAKSLSIEIPANVLATADEVIE
ncbi:ABC transporter substrate-binding protein [Bradyrhizobium sp. 63_E2_N1_3]|uniref:ABC transporter substrate-binding protein n=1 Tax=Bradyrhizobium sp. 63_E2_N1_3 TaxID=3240373 RepID=UPI003F8A37AF